MLLSLFGFASGLLAFGVAQTGTPVLHVEHTPPACLLAEKPSRLVACLVPRRSPAILRVLFRADGGTAWYSTPLRSDTPCYSALLPRPNRATTRIVYFIEAEGRAGDKARTEEQAVAVVTDAASCPGRVASTAIGQRAAWDAPPGEPRVPPGFEGASLPASTGRAPAPPPAPAPAPTAPSAKAPPLPPPPPKVPPPPATKVATEAPKGGGHGLRNAALVAAGLAAAGGAAALATQKSDGGAAATPPPLGSGLPASGVSGVYVGTETVNYAGGCVGTDDVVLNLQEASGALSGVLSFTVRTCSCCASGRGANPVAGSLAGTSLQLGTPIGFNYSGSFAGNRLSGALAGPDGVTGSWSVDKR